ncbi:uncharacterized protein G2W53_033064 [Senna tora]|uniref:Uncharacterized protein n=1 Tax=Senna tora TaxID=362788 RepID=A0A834W861_9FABA|nr:uncharacterized protein G2W53_033064 [Senna tora]
MDSSISICPTSDATASFRPPSALPQMAPTTKLLTDRVPCARGAVEFSVCLTLEKAPMRTCFPTGLSWLPSSTFQKFWAYQLRHPHVLPTPPPHRSLVPLLPEYNSGPLEIDLPSISNIFFLTTTVFWMPISPTMEANHMQTFVLNYIISPPDIDLRDKLFL